METSGNRSARQTKQGQMSDRSGDRKAEGVHGSFRELTFEEFPQLGHMLVVSHEWDAVYWLADRHAVIRAGAVELDGSGQKLLEAPADKRGVITFEQVREHDVTSVAEGTPAARAINDLTDPERVEESLYPPYISDVLARPKRPYLRHPWGLIYRDALVLNQERREVYWLLTDYGHLDSSGVFAAPVYGHGPVFWGKAFDSTHHPEWVLPALIHHARD